LVKASAETPHKGLYFDSFQPGDRLNPQATHFEVVRLSMDFPWFSGRSNPPKQQGFLAKIGSCTGSPGFLCHSAMVALLEEAQAKEIEKHIAKEMVLFTRSFKLFFFL